MKRYFTDAESDPKALPPATRKKLRVAAEDVKRRLSANKVVEVIVKDLDRELGESGHRSPFTRNCRVVL